MGVVVLGWRIKKRPSFKDYEQLASKLAPHGVFVTPKAQLLGRRVLREKAFRVLVNTLLEHLKEGCVEIIVADMSGDVWGYAIAAGDMQELSVSFRTRVLQEPDCLPF